VSLYFFVLSWLYFRRRRRSPSLDLWRFSCQTSIFNNEHDRQQTPLTNPQRTRQHQLQTAALNTFPSPLVYNAQTPDWIKSTSCSTALIPLVLGHTQPKIKTTNKNTTPNKKKSRSNILTHAYNTLTVWIHNARLFFCQAVVLELKTHRIPHCTVTESSVPDGLTTTCFLVFVTAHVVSFEEPACSGSECLRKVA
jgi:hypothetical protein